jgi:thioredoxin reductase (NADPH)
MKKISAKVYFFIFFVFFYSSSMATGKRELYLKNWDTLSKNILKNSGNKYLNNVATTVVIGSGVAGLSAAIYVARLGGVGVIICGENDGGQITKASLIENWPGVGPLPGIDIISGIREQVEKSGIYFVSSSVKLVSVDKYPYEITLSNGSKIYAFSIIVSTGASSLTLGCEGEDKYFGNGVSVCALCDAPFCNESNVIVVGGGDLACADALQVASYAKSVAIIVRSSEMKASKVLQDRVNKNEKIKVLYNTKVISILGNKGGISKVRLNGNGNIFDLSAQKVFIAIGTKPNTDFLNGILELDENGLIVCKDRTQETSIMGIFAAGDNCNQYKQAGVASGEGIKAAIDSYYFLQEIGINNEVIENNPLIWFKGKSNIDNSVDASSGEVNDDLSDVDLQMRNDLEDYVPVPDEIIASLSLNNADSAINSFDFNKIVEIKTIDEYNDFLQYMQGYNGFYLLDLSASFCPACKVLHKALLEYIGQKDHLPVASIVLDEVEGIMEIFNFVRSVPMVLLYRGNELIKKSVGAMSMDEIRNFLSRS